MFIGYARVSKSDNSQVLDLQIDALKNAGVDENNNVTITAEAGDNETSLTKFMGDGYSSEQISTMYNSMKGGLINLTETVGGVFSLMTESMNDAQSKGLPSTAGLLSGTEFSKGQNYNCWGTAIALNEILPICWQ